MDARSDVDLTPWLFGIVNGVPHGAGSFLQSLADAMVRADPQNYAVLRPAVMVIKAKYPNYHDPSAKAELA